MSSLLARFAENAFWLARYTERAENLARILDVNETFARDSRGSNDWLAILKLHCDEDAFFERYREADSANVVRFYIIDGRNPNSIVCSVRNARENARSIRHLISLETWVQINVFYNWVASLNSRSLKLAELSRLCARIKEGCQLHSGIVSGTLYRDQVWSFYRLGVFIELSDQITRLVDIKYHSLLPDPADVGSPIDVSQWNALLRSASAYHGYRRVYPRVMTPATVAGFILLDPRFPRSINHCARHIEMTIDELLRQDDLVGVEFPREALERLKSLAARRPEEVVASGLHEFIDDVQLAIIELARQVGDTFFAIDAPAQAQSQSQA